MQRDEYITAADLRDAAARTGGMVGLTFIDGGITAWVQEEDTFYDVEFADESPWRALQGAVELYELYLHYRAKPGAEG